MENIIYRNNEGIEYIQFKRLLEYPEVTHCYTMRSNNQLNFQIKNIDFFRQSCDRILKSLNLENTAVVRTYQTHTDTVEKIEKVKNIDELKDVDGVVTNKKDIALLTTSADCISFLLYDPVKKAIGSIHSGWKGTLKRIIIKAIEKMITEYHSKPEDIICCICPSIRQCCFEVDEDVKNMFYEAFKDENIISLGEVKDGKQKYYIDTVLANINMMRSMGLKEENIIDSKICTVCNSDKMHSYRVEKELSGRNTAIIAIK